VPSPPEPSNPDARSPEPPRTMIARAGAPLRFVLLAFLSFHPSAMPWLARANYARELRAAFFLPWAIAATEGGVIGFIVRKLYDGVVDPTVLNYCVGALVAAPAFANITSFLWAMLASGKRKIPFITAIQLAMLVSVFIIALAPRTPAGLALLLIAAFAARICLAGVVTIRATVWGVNYPKSRARISGKIQTIMVAVSSIIAMALGLAMQEYENSYRILLPIFGSVALLGVGSYARIRVRREPELLARERETTADSTSRTGAGLSLIRAMLRVLTDDRDYRRYQTCQLMIGMGNMMSWTPFVIIAKEQFNLDYLPGLLLTHIVPLIMMPLFIPLWATYLDKVHIVVFRSVHSWVFIGMFLLALLAGQTGTLWLLYAASVLRGIAFGGGALAWNLGHLSYVKPERSTDYMAVHVTLTGARGLTAPFLGVAIYEAIQAVFPGEGSWVFAVGLAITLCGTIGFLTLRRELPTPTPAD